MNFIFANLKKAKKMRLIFCMSIFCMSFRFYAILTLDRTFLTSALFLRLPLRDRPHPTNDIDHITNIQKTSLTIFV